MTAITIEAVTVHRKDKDEHGGVAFAEVQFQQRRKKSGG